ncbi:MULTISPECIES: hypothetical protein [unclassified Helicobacter]|uniref:hypothetical protein n=1 Tax=unclassified Helicobacter TaxID=2593540 RepID=UPI00115FEB11|nr:MULTISPECIES: hypothetical protein [unclassified Helicobacter]
MPDLSGFCAECALDLRATLMRLARRLLATLDSSKSRALDSAIATFRYTTFHCATTQQTYKSSK